MGPAGREVKAASGAPVMFVEIYYEYTPFMYASFIGNKRIQYTAAFNVRDARDTSNIFNPSTAAVVNSCANLAPPPGDGKNGGGNDPIKCDPSNPSATCVP